MSVKKQPAGVLALYGAPEMRKREAATSRISSGFVCTMLLLLADSTWHGRNAYAPNGWGHHPCRAVTADTGKA